MTDFPPIGEPFDHVNRSFHERYDDDRDGAWRNVPVLVVLKDELVLVQGKTQTRRTFSSKDFHAAKSVAHAPIAAYLLLSRGTLTNGKRASLTRLAASLKKIDREGPFDDLATFTRKTIERALDGHAIDAERFAKEAGARERERAEKEAAAKERAAHEASERRWKKAIAEARAALRTAEADAKKKQHAAETADAEARERIEVARKLAEEAEASVRALEDAKRKLVRATANEP